MWIIPAIDLKDGKVVRLTQGAADKATTYLDDPRVAAERWIEAGAKRLHVIDLDGAFEGVSKNIKAVETLIALAIRRGVEVQVGGGIRTTEHVERLLDLGVSQAILGTAVLENPGWLSELIDDFGKRLMVSMDVNGPFVAVRGWTKETRKTAVDVLEELKKNGLHDTFALICTDITRDGTLQGPNVDLFEEMMMLSPVPLIAAGGISAIEDLDDLRKRLPELKGVVTGKAIYEGTLDLKAAIAKLSK